MKYDFLIIGGGIIGLNVAICLKQKYSGAKVCIIEKEKEVAMHSSGRNSGVLHAGFYYSADSLKAKFTRDGNAVLRQFCSERKLPINHCGKVVVATNESELEGLAELKKRGDNNGVELIWLNEDELEKKFSEAKTYKKALYSPTTATVNPKLVTKEFAKMAEDLGIEIKLDTKYIKNGDDFIVTNNGKIYYSYMINAAGLYADKIAKDYDIAHNFVIIPFKGIYLKDKKNKCDIHTNIYPVPNLANPFLGVHYTLTVDNEAKIGPTAIPAFWRENYKGFANFKADELAEIFFYESKLFFGNAFGFRKLAFDEVRKYIKSHFLRLATVLTNNLDHSGFTNWSEPGIRAQLLNTKTLELVQDFEVQNAKNSTHILNAVSPAFTCSVSFSKWVVDEFVKVD